MELDPYFIAYTKINSKWIKNLNRIIQTKNSQKKKKTERKLGNTGFGNDFLDMTPKAEKKKKAKQTKETVSIKAFEHQRIQLRE